MSSDTTYLSIGDYICLFYVKLSSNLCAEGILSEDVVVGEGKEFNDCLFQIHLQRQYSATSELEHFLTEHNQDVEAQSEAETSADSLAMKRFHQALDKGQVNEAKMNAHFLQQKMGNPVLFGDIIQLFHVKSGHSLSLLISCYFPTLSSPLS